jgi:FMN phosphatase YigB (HAD superfamily)
MIHHGIPLQEIRVVTWDVDGTLFSFAHLARQLFKRTVDSVKSKGWIKTGTALCQLLQYYTLVQKQRRRPDCVVVLSEFEDLAECRIYEREALEFALRRIKPRPIALQLLQYFAKNGAIQIALSDFECDYKLEALGLSQYFQKAYSCRDIGFWKPSPVPLLKIQTEFGFRPDEHLHIGDRLDTDGEACARNGCRFLFLDGAFKFSLNLCGGAAAA